MKQRANWREKLRNGWYRVASIQPSVEAARLTEMGLAPGSRVWIATQAMPFGLIYLHTSDGALIVREEELKDLTLEPEYTP
ncbi:MAG: ferrous iron transport protein A [Flavobacteriales bacterium]|nr:ferrous iron transport protein A [Flavobacteriales bacterium]MCX7767423.1 ferrous iron transport protein A [Flavobacteriales bacterium]MDW8410063.1 hypothetical protein [Flavobacteriales bacterium]